MTRPTTDGAAVAAAVEQARDLLASERAEQLDLIAVPDAGAVADARDALGPMAPREAVLSEARRRGRPKGATNKRSDDFARWILQFGPHPAVTMMRVQGMRTEDLAKVAGCKPIEALDRQIKCAAELLPYLEGKKPVAIDLAVRGDMMLSIEGLTDADGAAGPVLDMYPLDNAEMAENRHFSGDDLGELDA